MNKISALRMMFTIGLADIAELMVDAVGLKGSGKLITLPFSFDVRMMIMNEQAELFRAKIDLETKQSFEANGMGYIEDMDEYIELSMRFEEILYLHANDNYISVWGSLSDESSEGEAKGLYDHNGDIIGYHYASHDSGWRDGVSRFQKICFNALEKHFKPIEDEMVNTGIKCRYSLLYHASTLTKKATIKESVVVRTPMRYYQLV